jgi:hypothetical protein
MTFWKPLILAILFLVPGGSLVLLAWAAARALTSSKTRVLLLKPAPNEVGTTKRD